MIKMKDKEYFVSFNKCMIWNFNKINNVLTLDIFFKFIGFSYFKLILFKKKILRKIFFVKIN